MDICGVEEAGRGPVIGPLVMCGILIEDSQEDEFRKMGARDSKQLSPLQRERLYDRILKTAKKHVIIQLQPAEIDAAVSGASSTNLNWLEGDTTARIITELMPQKAILDCPSPNIPAYAEYVKGKIPAGIEVVAEHKADENHPVVSAASIIAKVTRDREIQRIKNTLGVDFGSGYPADPLTQAFLKKYHKTHAHLFRTSWASYKNAAITQARLGDF